MCKVRMVVSLIICLGAAFSLYAQVGNYYRYKDQDGQIAISSTLPPEVAKQGYEIISPRGNVLETVPPEKTPQELAKEAEEKARQKEAEEKAAVAKKAAEAEAKKDQVLLRSFSSADDIARSRDEKISSIKVLQEIANDNINRLQLQLDKTKATIEQYQREGQKIPESLEKTLITTQQQISENQAFLEQKEKEIKQIYTEYQGWIDRYQELHKRFEQSFTH